MTQPTIATAADYADALITARRAKTVLFIFLLLFLLIQLAIFFVAAFTENVIFPRTATVEPAPTEARAAEPAPAAPAEPAADSPAAAPAANAPAGSEEAAAVIRQQTRLADVLQYFTAVFNVAGIVLAIVLSLVLLILLLILLVGRLMGVSQLTSSWIWSVVLALFFFPWQAFHVIPLTAPVVEEPAMQRWDFRLAGVLYTWSELAADHRFVHEDRRVEESVLKWVRFVVFPVAAIIILLMVHIRSNRGLRRELGDAVDVEPRESFHA